MARIGASGNAGPGLRKDPLSWPEILSWGGLKTWKGQHKPKFNGYNKNIELFLRKDFQAGQVLGMKAGFLFPAGSAFTRFWPAPQLPTLY